MEVELLYAFVSVVVGSVIFYLTVPFNDFRRSRELSSSRRILFVTAHPDDECMFFGPTIVRLTQRNDTAVYLMCLSEGNFDKLGQLRRTELWKSTKLLGIPDAHVTLKKHTYLPDDPTAKWSSLIISQLIVNMIKMYDIDTLITFDDEGVSGHANHCAIYNGVVHMITEKNLPKGCDVFVLATVNIFRKYSLIFDIPFSFLFSSNAFLASWSEKNRIVNAMKAHRSQFVWFRQLYVMFSRYMFINTLWKLDVADIMSQSEFDLPSETDNSEQ